MARLTFLSTVAVILLCEAFQESSALPMHQTAGLNERLVKLSLCKDFRVSQELWEAFCGVQGTGKRGGEMEEELIDNLLPQNDRAVYLNEDRQDVDKEFNNWFKMFVRKMRDSQPTIASSAPMYII